MTLRTALLATPALLLIAAPASA
ncbi:MAG: hypothetical protein JWM65_2584, partial [Sphingomonas bacterium]|nr:hypothetical protein [Sphingomonas bacterium]